MTRVRTAHLVWWRLHRLLTTVLTLVGMAILFIAGCDPATGMLPDERGITTGNVNEDDEFDPFELAITFWDEAVYQNEEVFASFADQIDALTTEQTELLVQEIDLLVAELSPSAARLSESIHVYWDAWPSGRYPNAAYVVNVAACGSDYDVGCRYNNVPNAYSNPGALWFETNSAVVYGVMAAHNYDALAYDITTTNTVRICVGVGGSSTYWYVNWMKNYFWGGLAINP